MSGPNPLGPSQIVLNRVDCRYSSYYVCVVDGVATGELSRDEALWSVARALCGLPPQYTRTDWSELPKQLEDQS